MVEQNLYVHDYIDVSYERVVEFLERSPTGILQRATDSASARAHEVLSTLYVPLGGFELARDVTVTVGDVDRVEATRSKLPLSWHATQHRGLFPTMNAFLEVSALSLHPPLTQVSIIGTYVPPAGLVGALGDSLHRLGDVAVHRLVRDVCAHLNAELSS